MPVRKLSRLRRVPAALPVTHDTPSLDGRLEGEIVRVNAREEFRKLRSEAVVVAGFLRICIARRHDVVQKFSIEGADAYDIEVVDDVSP